MYSCQLWMSVSFNKHHDSTLTIHVSSASFLVHTTLPESHIHGIQFCLISCCPAKPNYFSCFRKCAVLLLPFYCYQSQIFHWLTNKAVTALLRCCGLLHIHGLSAISLSACDSTPSEFLESSFPCYPTTAAPTSLSLHIFFFFLFLVLVKSGMACVFHHRNRHNRRTQPSSGSANRDQIKSIIRLVCAKAFFFFPLLSLLEALTPYRRPFQQDKEGGGLEQSFEHRCHSAGCLLKAISASICTNNKAKMQGKTRWLLQHQHTGQYVRHAVLLSNTVIDDDITCWEVQHVWCHLMILSSSNYLNQQLELHLIKVLEKILLKLERCTDPAHQHN